MNPLITAEDVRNRMGLDPALAAGVDPVITSYITSAQLRMESALESMFDPSTRSDMFLLDSTKVGGVVPDGWFRLLLKCGFVQSDATFTVDGVDDGEWSADYERGIVYVLEKYESTVVTVGYTAGFDAGHAAPDWLREVLISTITPLINSLQMTGSGSSGSKGAISSFYDAVNRHIDDIVSNHRRNPGLTIKAIQ